MRSSGSTVRRALGLLAAISAAAAGAWLAGGGAASLRARLEGPEVGIRRALANAAAGGAAAGEGLRLDRLRYTDLLVREIGGRAEVVAAADADGEVAWRGHAVRLSYLGREELRMARCPGAGWCPEGASLPRLAALLGLLAARADALDDGDAGRYPALVADDYRGPEGGKAELLRRLAADLGAAPRARFVPIAWQVRIERGTAQVGEDYELAVGGAPPRRLRARLDLREEAGRWRITGGL